MSFLAMCSAHATIDVTLQMQLGNPSGATTDTNNHNHYLIQRTVEAIDYNDSLRQPNWASWDLTAGDVPGGGVRFAVCAGQPVAPTGHRAKGKNKFTHRLGRRFAGRHE
jgi:hypothetical protein